jgi:chromosome segregation ATPase
MDPEEMERELWRLRSVEIDLERAQDERDALKVVNSELTIHVQNTDDKYRALETQRDKIQKTLKDAMERAKSLAESLQKAEDALTKMGRERQYLADRLYELEQAEYMVQNYDFKVTDKMPERKGKNWRLSK